MGPNRYISNNGSRWNCCSSLFKFIFFLGITILFFWLIYRPTKVKAYVDSASLYRFNLNNSNNSLDFNLNLNISIRNPNRRVGFYYDSVEAHAMYDGLEFGFDSLPAFYQGHKSTALLSLEFKGKATVAGSSLVNGTFERERREGFFFIEEKLFTKVRMKVMFFKIGHFKPRIGCVTRLPVPANKASNQVAFEKTKCDFDL